MMVVPNDLVLTVSDGMAQGASSLAAASRTRAVQGQADPPRLLEDLVPLRSPHTSGECLTGDRRIEPLGKIGQGVVAEQVCHRQGAACPGVDEALDGVKGPLPDHFADDQGPEQGPGVDLGSRPPVTGTPEIAGQLQAPAREPLEAPRAGSV